MDQLLAFALPCLQSFFQPELRSGVNLRLGLFEQYQTPTHLVKRFFFPTAGRSFDFSSAVPDWDAPFVNLTENELLNLAYSRRLPTYLNSDQLFVPLPSASHSIHLSKLAYPLFGPDETSFGAVLEVEVQDLTEGAISEELREALAIFGTALANARRFGETQNKLRQLETLNANRDELIRQPDLRLMLEITVRRAMTLLNAEGGTFYLADYEHKEVECFIDLNPAHNMTGVRLKFGEGLAGRVVETGQLFYVDDYNTWEGRSTKFGVEAVFKAILGAPVIWNQQVIGILSLMSYRAERTFTEQDAALLDQFATQAASVISLNRMLEDTRRSERELELLNQAATLVNRNLELPAICEAFITQLADKFGYRYIFIYLKDEDGRIRIKAKSGYESYMTELDENVGICGRVLRTGQAQLVRNAALDPDFVYHTPLTGGVYVPLMYKAELLGIIGIEVNESRVGESDLRLLENLGAHLSVAIKNAYLFKQFDQQTNQSIRRNQELEAVFFGLNEGLLILRKGEGQIEFQINPEGLRLLGWGEHTPTQAELSDPTAYEMHLPVPGARSFYERSELPPAARPLRREEWPDYRAMRGERFSSFELLVKGHDGHLRSLTFAGAPLTNTQGEVVQAVIVFHDVTALRAVEQMRDGFLSLVSHDIRAPLAAITGYAEQAQENLSLDSPKALEGVRRSLQVILRHTERLSRLVSDLLDMARLESGRLRLDLHPYNLAPLVRNACRYIIETMPSQIDWEADPAAPERLYFNLELDRTIPKVLIDQERFDQVLMNLISNAVKYSDHGGEIHVKVTADPANPAYALLSIQDQGMGIDPEKLSNLFSRFYRTEQAEQSGFGGTGLGLYICRMMVEALNGRIRAESAGAGQGTTFYVTLPFTTLK